MFKLLGSICILCGCIGWGYGKAGEEKSRVFHLREIIRIIKRIQSEMAYGKRTLPEICAILASCGDERYRACFGRIYEELLKLSGVSAEQIWKKETVQCLAGIPLPSEEKDVLINLMQNLGMQEEKIQASNIGQSLDMMERRLRQAEEACAGKTKMILSISALAGMFLVILLL